MEENLPAGMAKKIWDLVRVAFFMIRKGISKKKILLDLNIMMKRRKLAGKSLRNLIFHHHHHSATADEKRRPHHFDDVDAVSEVVEIMSTSTSNYSEIRAFPAGIRLKSSPMEIRQLRVTDSPYPVQDNPDENSRRVDQAAEDFINRFYNQLKQQQ